METRVRLLKKSRHHPLHIHLLVGNLKSRFSLQMSAEAAFLIHFYDKP